MDGGIPLAQVIGEHFMSADHGQLAAIGLFHHLYTPFHIGRMAVFQVITVSLGDV